MELTLETFLIIQGIIIAVILAIIKFQFTIWGKINKMEGFIEAISQTAINPPKYLIDEIQKISPEKTNPYNPIRKKELIDKWQSGRLNVFEAQELKRILSKTFAF